MRLKIHNTPCRECMADIVSSVKYPGMQPRKGEHSVFDTFYLFFVKSCFPCWYFRYPIFKGDTANNQVSHSKYLPFDSGVEIIPTLGAYWMSRPLWCHVRRNGSTSTSSRTPDPMKKLSEWRAMYITPSIANTRPPVAPFCSVDMGGWLRNPLLAPPK